MTRSDPAAGASGPDGGFGAEVRHVNDAVAYQISGPVCTVTLTRGRQRNSLVWASWLGLDAALSAAISEPGVRAVVLAGEGGFFSSGGDQKSTPASGARGFAPAARIELAHQLLVRLHRAPVILIAAVEGGAVGMGWSLALACDLVVSAESASFSAPFTRLGLVPDGGAAWHLVRTLGRHRASELVLTGRRLSAREALELGLVIAVVPDKGALTAAQDMAKELGACDPVALEYTKRLLRIGPAADLGAFLDQELALATLIQSRRAR
jgi:enoyl-CoA hydratase/carnithine racemase